MLKVLTENKPSEKNDCEAAVKRPAALKRAAVRCANGLLKIASVIATALIVHLCAAVFPAFAADEARPFKFPSLTKFGAVYEGRFNIIDPGDSTGRHAIFNILWLDLEKLDTSGVSVFARAKAVGFEGDSFVKQHSGINELDALTVNEAYIKRCSKKYEFDFGMFHRQKDNPGTPPLFDLSELSYGFDPMNPVAEKKAKGNLYYGRDISCGACAFINYRFDVDYSSSLKSYGLKYGGITVERSFNDMRDYLVADYAGVESREVNFTASYRNNRFRYLSPFSQYRAGAVFRPARNASSKLKFTSVTAELLFNSTPDGYYMLKRNAADLISASVLFFYQKYAGALKIESSLADRFRTKLSLESYFAIKPQFGTADGLTEDIGRVRTYKLSAVSHYSKAAVETAVLKTTGGDGSYLLEEKLNFRLRVLYPF